MHDHIISELIAERQAQDAQWGGPVHDDEHTYADWICLLTRHVGLAVNDGNTAAPDRFRRQMLRVAAIAVAAIETMDRAKAVEKVAGADTTHWKGW